MHSSMHLNIAKRILELIALALEKCRELSKFSLRSAYIIQTLNNNKSYSILDSRSLFRDIILARVQIFANFQSPTVYT